MRTQKLRVLLTMVLGLTGALTILAVMSSLGSEAPIAQANSEGVITVCTAGPPDCTYSIIQDAVDAASDGDVIKLAAGTYTHTHARPAPVGFSGSSVITQVVYVTKSITIRGGYTLTNGFVDPPDPVANPTILDAKGKGRVMLIQGEINPVLEGLRITGGDPTGSAGFMSGSEGGGILIAWASATISNCTVHHNAAAYYGGGLFLGQSNSTIFSNTIASNEAGGEGGGLYLKESASIIISNTIENNLASHNAGGLCLRDSNDIVQGNLVLSNTASYVASGIDAVEGQPIIRGNHVLANGPAAGVRVTANATVDGNVISGNQGGGLGLFGQHQTVLNNLIVDNQGDGIDAYGGSSQLVHNTLARNSGRGIDVSNHHLTISNTILVSHTTGVYVSYDGSVAMEGTLWGSGIWSNGSDWSGDGEIVTGTVNIWADPGFEAAGAGDYHIGAGSAARDAGVDAGVWRDVDGQVRPMSWRPDIGADEFPDVGLDLLVELPSPYVNRGTSITYTIRMTNAGFGAATGVILTDTLAPWQRATQASASLGTCTLVDPGWGGHALCEPGSLAEGESAVITLTADISEAVPLRQLMDNTVLVASNETANTRTITSYAQDCHVRLNDAPTPFNSVQAAVDAASEDDLVKIAGACVGVRAHNGEHQQVSIAKSLTVQGGYATDNWATPTPILNPTVLDALGQGRVVAILGDESQPAFTVTLKGLWIMGGDVGEDDQGGGIRVKGAAVTMQDCWVYSNTAEAGGGVSLYQAVGVLRGNVFQGNHAYYIGGGFAASLSDILVISNTFYSNSSDVFGGGGSLYGGQVARGNLLMSNTALYGGGIYFGQDAVLEANVIQNNYATHYGGGIAGRGCSGTLAENSILSNGNHGVYLEVCSNILMRNNLIADNTGIGIWVYGSQLDALHTTLARNGSYGLYLNRAYEDSVASITNTILVSHTTGVRVSSGSLLDAEGTLWGSGIWSNGSDWSGSGTIVTGTVNYWDIPGFVAPDAGNYHIGPASAAIDSGVDAGVTTDIDGDPRPAFDGYDLGADEYLGLTNKVYLPVIMRGP